MTEATELKVWLDFVCPFCLLAAESLKEATEGLDVSIEWMPFELRPSPEPTLRPEGEYLQSVWRYVVYPMAAQMSVPIRLPDVSPQPYTRLAFEGLQFAREHGKAGEYTHAVLRAFFQQSLDIGRLDVLSAIAERVGLSAEAFRAALRQGRYTKAHDTALRIARDFGVRAVPTILVGSHRIQGAPDATTLRQAIEHERAARNNSNAAARAAPSQRGSADGRRLKNAAIPSKKSRDFPHFENATERWRKSGWWPGAESNNARKKI